MIPDTLKYLIKDIDDLKKFKDHPTIKISTDELFDLIEKLSDVASNLEQRLKWLESDLEKIKNELNS